MLGHTKILEEVNLALCTWNWKSGTLELETATPPSCASSFIPFQSWCKCHPKSFTSLGHHYTMLCWQHDLPWWESIPMHLVSWVGIVILHGDAKVDAVVTPFMKGKMVAPDTCHDTLPKEPQCTPASSQPGYFFIKTCRKSKICPGMYKVSKTWVQN